MTGFVGTLVGGRGRPTLRAAPHAGPRACGAPPAPAHRPHSAARGWLRMDAQGSACEHSHAAGHAKMEDPSDPQTVPVVQATLEDAVNTVSEHIGRISKYIRILKTPFP